MVKWLMETIIEENKREVSQLEISQELKKVMTEHLLKIFELQHNLQKENLSQEATWDVLWTKDEVLRSLEHLGLHVEIDVHSGRQMFVDKSGMSFGDMDPPDKV